MSVLSEAPCRRLGQRASIVALLAGFGRVVLSRHKTKGYEVIQLDRAAIASFLGFLEDGLHLCSIPVEGGSCNGRWFGTDSVAATNWAMIANNRGNNVYWTVNLVAEKLNKKPGKEDIVAPRYVHVDIDPPKDGGALDKVLKQAELIALPVPPSLIIDSGGGLQAFWRLAGSASLTDVETVNRNLAKQLGGDNCHSIEHLMRLPGTVNYPNAKKRDRGRVIALAKVIYDADRILH